MGKNMGRSRSIKCPEKQGARQGLRLEKKSY